MLPVPPSQTLQPQPTVLRRGQISPLDTTNEEANPWGLPGCLMPDAPRRFSRRVRTCTGRLFILFVFLFPISSSFCSRDIAQGWSPHEKVLT